MDSVDSRLPPASRTGWLQTRLLNDWPSTMFQPTPRKSAWVQHPTVLCICGLWKSFDSTEFKPVFHALKNHGVDKVYLNIIKYLYHKATSVNHLHTDIEKFRLKRGVRQGDNISPRLFTSCLPDAIIGKINWKDRGMKINAEYLSRLIFADDIVLITELTSEVQKTLQDIYETSRSQYTTGKDFKSCAILYLRKLTYASMEVRLKKFTATSTLDRWLQQTTINNKSWDAE